MSFLSSQRNRRVGIRLPADDRFAGISGSIPRRSKPA